MLPGTYADATLAVGAVLVHPEDDQYMQIACHSQGATSQYRFAFRPATGEVWINRWFARPGVGGDVLPGCSQRGDPCPRAPNRSISAFARTPFQVSERSSVSSGVFILG